MASLPKRILPALGITDSPDPLLIAREGAAILQISVPTFWRHVANGLIPKPVKLGGLSRWPKSEILAVIETAKAARSAPAKAVAA